MRTSSIYLRCARIAAGLAALGAAAYLPVSRAGATPAAPPVAGVTGPTAPAELAAVDYGTDGGPLAMDVYLPAVAGPRRDASVPVVVVLHGGGWAGGSRADVTPEAQALAAAGLAVLDVDYRLTAPGRPGYPYQLSDVGQALAWAGRHSASLGLDMRRVGALGVSAGGNLALELGVRGLASSVVAWSAPTDLAAFEAPGSRCTTAACGPLSLPYAVYQYLGCLPESCPGAYQDASPVARASAPGTRYLVWSSTDELVPVAQADEFTARQRAAGAVVTEQLLAGHLHAAQYAATALGPSVAFLVSSLGGGTAG